MHHSVKLEPQAEDYLCWEACARMIYRWKHGKLGDYEKLVAADKALGRGLARSEMGHLYCKRLGMATHPRPRDVIARSPLIWTVSTKERGHAMILIGFDPKRGFINYNPGSSLDFQGAASVTAHSADAGTGQASLGGKLAYVSEKRLAADSDGLAWGYVR